MDCFERGVGVASRYDTFGAASRPSKRAGRRMWSYRPSGMRGTRRVQKALSGGRLVERCHWKLNARHVATDHALSNDRRFLTLHPLFSRAVSMTGCATHRFNTHSGVRNRFPIGAEENHRPEWLARCAARRATFVRFVFARKKQACRGPEYEAKQAEVEARNAGKRASASLRRRLTSDAPLRNAAPRRQTALTAAQRTAVWRRSVLSLSARADPTPAARG